MGRRPMSVGAASSIVPAREVSHLSQSSSPTLMMQPRHLRLEASMQLPHERNSMPLLPFSCSMESISTIVVHGTTNARNPQHDGVHTMAALVHGNTAQVSCNGLTFCTRCNDTMTAVIGAVLHSPRRASRWSLAICRPCISTTLLTALSIGRIVLQLHCKRDRATQGLHCVRLHGAGAALKKVDSCVRHFGVVLAFPVQNAAVLQT